MKDTETIIGDAVDDCPLFLTVKDVALKIIERKEKHLPSSREIAAYLKQYCFHIGRGLYYLYNQDAFEANLKKFAPGRKLTSDFKDKRY